MDTQDSNPYAPPQEAAPKEPWRLLIARGVIVLTYVLVCVSFPYTMDAFYGFVRSTRIFKNPGDCFGFSMGFGMLLCPFVVGIPGIMLAKLIYPDIGKRPLFGRPRT